MKWWKHVFGLLIFITIICGSTFLFLKTINNKVFLTSTNQNSKTSPNKKTKKQRKLFYNNLELTNKIPKIPKTKKEFLNSDRFKILNLLGIKWNPNSFISGSLEKLANYNGIPLGKLKSIEELANDQFIKIANFSLNNLDIKGTKQGTKETRVSVYQMCKNAFSYFICDINPKIRIPFLGFGEFVKGEPKPIDMNNQDFVKNLIKSYPIIKNKLASIKLVLISIEGQEGNASKQGIWFYLNQKIINVPKGIKTKEDFKKTKYIEIFSFLINKNLFHRFIPSIKPTYNHQIISWLGCDVKKENLSLSQKLRILGWKEELLRIE